MGILYDRKEDSEEIVIRLKYHAMIYVLMIIIFPLALADILFDFVPPRSLEYVLMIIMFVFLVIFVNYWKPFREVRLAMKTGRVLISGSKFSFSNPFTFVIEKKEKNK